MRARESIRGSGGVKGRSPQKLRILKLFECHFLIKLYSNILLHGHAMPLITNLSDPSVKKIRTHGMTASSHLRTALGIAYEHSTANSEARGRRSNCSACYARGNVDIRFIEPEAPYSGRGTIFADPHTARQKSKICPWVTPPDLPHFDYFE